VDSSSDRLEEENREKQLDMKSLQNKIKLSTGDGSKPEQHSRNSPIYQLFSCLVYYILILNILDYYLHARINGGAFAFIMLTVINL
jgi:F0F1-type ATP synthase assembly protein I